MTRNPDGSIAGKGCFTYETPADGGPAKLAAFYYNDKTIGTIDQSYVQTFQFQLDAQGGNRFAFVAASPTERLCSLHVDTSLAAQLTGIGGEGPQGYHGKTIDFPKLAEGTTTTTESTTIPAVDLVVVIDSSVSMKDEADSLSQAVAAAIETAKTKCPSDLRVRYLGIEGTFKNTRFDTTVKNYLVGTAKADESALRGRKKGSARFSTWATRPSRAAARTSTKTIPKLPIARSRWPRTNQFASTPTLAQAAPKRSSAKPWKRNTPA